MLFFCSLLVFLSLVSFSFTSPPGTITGIGHLPVLPPGFGEPLQDPLPLLAPPASKFSEKDAKDYLQTFGYLPEGKVSSSSKSSPPLSPFDFQMALLQFQALLGLHRSGELDSATVEAMKLARCGRKDMRDGRAPTTKIFQKLTLTWSVTEHPDSLSMAETREAIDEAFEKWRKAIPFAFVESKNASKADFVISFKKLKQKNGVVATSTFPTQSRIILDRSTKWTYRKATPAGALDIFPVLLHEIGHGLGLSHSASPSSALFPLFEGRPSSSADGSLPSLPTQDREALRHLYGVAADPIPQGEKGKCPKSLDALTAVSQSQWFLFQDNHVWAIRDKKVDAASKLISDVFPGGPEYVNASVSAMDLTLLISERHIFGYTFDGQRFQRASGFPRELHERVLFYPEAAFPLFNGSVVLLSGNVFATYDVIRNEPSILNDVSRYFPEMPRELKSGVEGQKENHYWMFTASSASDYDIRVKKLLSTRPLEEFLKCH